MRRVKIALVLLFVVVSTTFADYKGVVEPLQPIWQATVCLRAYCNVCQEEHSLGTGFLYSSKQVVTASHVIEGFRMGCVLGYFDPNSLSVYIDSNEPGFCVTHYRCVPEVDVAVVWIETAFEPNYVICKQKPLIGSRVYSVGHPFGFDRTVCSGVVSGLHRNVKGLSAIQDYIQTDIATNPGHSGAPLVDEQGRLVGMLTAGIGAQGFDAGLNFAVPVKLILLAIEKVCLEEELENFWQRRGYVKSETK